MHKLLSVFCILGFPSLSFLWAEEKGTEFEFTTMVAHWAEYTGPEYWELINAAKPELAQFGFYGAHFYSLSHTEQFGGYPAHFPMKGLGGCRNWFAERNRTLQQKGSKVIGHFNVGFLVGDPDSPQGPRGFFKWYRDLWDEELLGPKPPVDDPIDFLEKNADGSPRQMSNYSIGGMKEYSACLRNPHWQSVLKAWVKAGVENGVDGFIANYFYRKNCLCQYCQQGFREYMDQRHSAMELKTNFGISDLEKHQFEEIVCWHKPEESTPLRREMLRWSQISNKQAFDEVFHEYGRSLKPDLITSQWNHLSNFSQISGDERCLLPAELWGKEESYLWYSMGSSGVHTDLKNGVLADGTLQARYIRSAFRNKPFTLGKYEGVRIRAAISELVANGGSPMGFYARTKDPEARHIFATYYGFLDRNKDLYQGNTSYAEVALLYPRKAVHAGNLEPLNAFRRDGRALLNQHLLFNVIPDDMTEKVEIGKYKSIIEYKDGGFALPEDLHTSLSHIQAPDTVRVSASQPDHGGEIDLHFVNYNRVELPRNANGRPNPGRGAADENSIPVGGIQVDFVLPENTRVTAVQVIEPEQFNPQRIRFRKVENRVQFSMPVFRVYSVARIMLAPQKGKRN